MCRSLVYALATCLSFSLPTVSSAEPPSGEYDLSIGGEAEIWQPSGLSEYTEVVDGVEVSYAVDTVTDIAGGVTAVGTFTFLGAIDGQLAMALGGQVKGRTAKTKFKLTGSVEGEFFVEFVTVDVLGSASFKCDENPSDRATFLCTPRVKLCIYDQFDGKKLGCTTVKGQRGEQVLVAEGGESDLYMALETSPAGVISGTAEVQLATGEILEFIATGRYNARSDTSTIDIRGVGGAIASRIKLSKLALSGGTATAAKINLRLAGQKGKAEIP